MVDEPLNVTVADPNSADSVWVVAWTEDGAGQSWYNQVKFDADEGRIRLQDSWPRAIEYFERGAKQ